MAVSDAVFLFDKCYVNLAQELLAFVRHQEQSSDLSNRFILHNLTRHRKNKTSHVLGIPRDLDLRTGNEDLRSVSLS